MSKLTFNFFTSNVISRKYCHCFPRTNYWQIEFSRLSKHFKELDGIFVKFKSVQRQKIKKIQLTSGFEKTSVN